MFDVVDIVAPVGLLAACIDKLMHHYNRRADPLCGCRKRPIPHGCLFINQGYFLIKQYKIPLTNARIFFKGRIIRIPGLQRRPCPPS